MYLVLGSRVKALKFWTRLALKNQSLEHVPGLGVKGEALEVLDEVEIKKSLETVP